MVITPVVVPAVRMSREVMTIRPVMVKNWKGTDAVNALVPFFLLLLEHEWPRMEHESYKNWVLRGSGSGFSGKRAGYVGIIL